MEETIESLKKKLRDYENQQSLFVKEGKIVYINDPESPTENFTKIEVGIDASIILNGKEIKDYFPCTVSKFNKELFAKLDQTGKPDFYPGDVVKVMCDTTSFQVGQEKDKGNRPKIFANVNLVRISLISSEERILPSGAKSSSSGSSSGDSSSSETYTVEGLEGSFVKGQKPESLPTGYEYDVTTKMIVKLPF